MPPWLRACPEGCEVRLKVVPGASRSGLAGVLGDRLKVRVAAPPEGGKANRAVEELIERLTGCRCAVCTGHATPLKTILVHSCDPEAVARALIP